MEEPVVVHERRRRQTKKWYTSKTVWLNVVAFLIAAAAVLQSSPLFAGYGEYFSIAVALLNLALRYGGSDPLKLK